MKHLIFLFLAVLFCSCGDFHEQQQKVVVIDKAFSAGDTNWAPGFSMSGHYGMHVVTTHDKYVLFYKYRGRVCQESVSSDEYVNSQIGDTIIVTIFTNELR